MPFQRTSFPSQKRASDGMIDDLAEGNGSGTPDLINERVATMSCKAAVKGNHTLSFAEADKLIDELLEPKIRMRAHMDA